MLCERIEDVLTLLFKTMITEKSTQQELFQEIEMTISQFVDMVLMLDNNRLNEIPYEDSWTAGQLCNHILKSTVGVVQAMKIDGKKTNRNSSEKIAELKNIFLNFSNKFQSPDEIVPDDGPFEKQKTIDDLTKCLKDLNFYSSNTDLSEEMDGGPLGSITKYELLHFVLYHSQRHLRQLKRIYEAVII
jgi:hypothetical protein